MNARIALVLCFLLAGCGVSDDTREFVKNAGKDLRGRVEPLPEVKPYEPFTYQADVLPDPFEPRKLQPAKGGGANQPDFNRPKEPLENYPLESLKMVGTLARGKVVYALVKTPDGTLYRVRPGNHMGQNFGVVTQITESEIKLTELVQDSAGDWSERQTSILLSEEASQPQKK